MDEAITIEGIDVRMSADLRQSRGKCLSDMPFRVLIMGDFSGRGNRGVETHGSDIDQRPLFKVDRDGDEALMENLGARLRLPVAGCDAPPVELTFREMDDFHPEQIYLHSDLFNAIRAVRKRLLDVDTFAETAAWLTAGTTELPDMPDPGAARQPSAKEPGRSVKAGAGLLDQVLQATSGPIVDGGDTPKPTDWNRFLADLVRPCWVPNIAGEQQAMVAGVDRTISVLMRRILHHPDFQALESVWRGLRFCLRRLETGEKLETRLLDVSKSELASALTANDDPTETVLYKSLAPAAGKPGQPASWSLLAGIYNFSCSQKDAALLSQLGGMGKTLGAPFVGAAAGDGNGAYASDDAPDPSRWTECPSPEDEKAWRALRRRPEAAWIGLVLPRFLMRLPYGQATEPVDAFDFEEMGDAADHEHYLWANPVFAMLLILGRTFSASGWNWSRGMTRDVDGLPLHFSGTRAQAANKPCAEVMLSERAVEQLIAGGLMPLASFKDQGRIRLLRFQSIADPPCHLSGRWQR